MHINLTIYISIKKQKKNIYLSKHFKIKKLLLLSIMNFLSLKFYYTSLETNNLLSNLLD